MFRLNYPILGELLHSVLLKTVCSFSNDELFDLHKREPSFNGFMFENEFFQQSTRGLKLHCTSITSHANPRVQTFKPSGMIHMSDALTAFTENVLYQLRC